MAAPAGIKWGSIYGSGKYRGRIGVYVKLTNTNTVTTRHVELWFWSEYNCYDYSNTLYYDCAADATAAETSRGSVSINCTVTTQWSTSNQKKIYDVDYDYTRGTSARTIKIYAKLADIEYVGKSMYVNTSFTVPALASYTISYNANGGSGAPASQKKYYGKALTLSGTKPTKPGHVFKGWATSAGGSVAYAAGSTIAAGTNSNLTLYAVWQANTYTVSYNPNGGSGAPASQTKTYGVALTLRGAPTQAKPNHTFKGWATSANGGVAYKAGGSYTANANVTLYAVWELAYTKPTIKNFSVSRSGTSVIVKFSWTSFVAAPTISIDWKTSNDSDYGTAETYTTSGTSGTFDRTLAYTSFSTNAMYTIRVAVNDGTYESYDVRSLPSDAYLIDFLKTKNGTAIGKIAEVENLFDVGWLSRFRQDVMIGEKTGYLDGNQGVYLDAEGFMHLQRSTSQGYHPYLGFFLDDATEPNGQVRVNASSGIMEFLNAAAYLFGNDIIIPSEHGIRGKDTNGNAQHIIGMSGNNNCIVGYDCHANNLGNTHIYGKDIILYSKTAGTNVRNYYRAGDSLTLGIHTSGYVTSSGTNVRFIVPLARPVIGSPTVTIASVDGMILRHNGAYTHGSSASVYVKPTSYTVIGDTDGNALIISATLNNTANVTNNDTISMVWGGTITFS